MEVHPLAAVFPMMTDDELVDLADDIKANGLLHNIVLDADGRLVDGRNRLRACEIAGVEPTFDRLNGHDAAAFIVSANLARRNLTKGQQAMALAFIYPEPGKGGRGKVGAAKEAKKLGGFTDERLRQARLILRHSRALAEDVLALRKAFDAALATVDEERAASQSAEAKLDMLRQFAPDLAELVAEGRLGLDEAYAAMDKRQTDARRAEENKRETMLRLSESAWRSTTAWASDDFLIEITERLDDKEFCDAMRERVRCDPARLAEIQLGAAALTTILTQIMEGGGDV
jgi:hypothetical protein